MIIRDLGDPWRGPAVLRSANYYRAVGSWQFGTGNHGAVSLCRPFDQDDQMPPTLSVELSIKTNDCGYF